MRHRRGTRHHSRGQRLESSGALVVSLGVGLGMLLVGIILHQGGTAPRASADVPAFSASVAPGVFAPPVSSAGPEVAPAEATPASLRFGPPPPPTVSRPDPAPEPAPEPDSAAREAQVLDGSLRRGDTLSSALRRQGVEPQLVSRIAQELSPLFDFRRARPGDRYRLALDEEGTLVSFRYRVSPLEAYEIRTAGGEWVAAREEVELERRRTRVAGVVENTLYDSIVELGASPQLASDFASIFAWDLDFNRSVKPGDRFHILYERLYRRGSDGRRHFVGPGNILAARYQSEDDEYTALYFETEDGRGGYYRPDGSSVERMFLAAPLRYRRISSSYSPSRFHPILKVHRPHFGIDYAAPVGTPVWAVADGTVIFRGRAGGFGRLVKVRHTNGYVSYYAHLSRFEKGLHVGKVVRQKEVIGYVGSSGLSTGPHVCFRIQKDGRYVNPATLRTPTGDPIPPERLAEFRSARAELLAELGSHTLVATDEAL